MNPPDFEPLRLLKNNAPLDDFCGLSPTEMHRLLYNPYGVKSPLGFQDSIEGSTLDSIPFFRLTEEFLKIVSREESIKLTPLGALPRKVLHELYDHRLITEDLIESGFSKLSREQDSVAITSVHQNTLLTGLIKKTKGKLSLTKDGKNHLSPDERSNLFIRIFSIFTNSFEWASNDGYPPRDVGQRGWAFTVYLIDKFGASDHSVEFYGDRYLKAFPKSLALFTPAPWGVPRDHFLSCYHVRAFTRFLEWFGFVTAESTHGVHNAHLDIVKRTDVFGKVFRFG
jgi:hypothetical protein